MIRFCHIAPTNYLPILTTTNGSHLILAHLVESDPIYRQYYADLADGKYKIMDNSAFEMYKQGRLMYPSDKLIEMGKSCNADCIVMSDYPGLRGNVTMEVAVTAVHEFKNAGFDNFFVPQSKIGDLDDYLETLQWAIDNPKIDLIGLSILGCPNAYGVEKSNNLQRYLSRYHILTKLAARYELTDPRLQDRFHCLGMVDGPNEIDLLRPFHDWIYSWDSSAAVWAGLNGVKFDNSPTGLVNGKFELEVDFNLAGVSNLLVSTARDNIAIIDSKVG